MQDWAVVGVEGSLIILSNLFVNGVLAITRQQPETLVADNS